VIVSSLRPIFSKRLLSTSIGAKRIIRIRFPQQVFLAKTQSFASFAALRLCVKLTIDFSEDDIQRSDNRHHIRHEMPDAHLPQRLKINK
jgi:hypothetical protein